MVDRLERLVNLTATLLDTRRALSLEEIAERVEPRYPDDLAPRRRQFERDKDTLRELGIPITVESVDGFGSEQAYRIKADDYYLPDLGLDEAELAALHLAVTAVRFQGGAGLDGLAKLGGLAGEGTDVALAELDVSPLVATLFDAVNRHASIEFEYRGAARRLDPYGVVLRFGHWYVVGRDRDRDAPRAFRIDRFDAEPAVGAAAGFEPPGSVDPGAFVRDPLTYGSDQPVDAQVLIDAARRGTGGRRARRVGSGRTTRRRLRRRHHARRQSDRVSHLGARPARARRGARSAGAARRVRRVAASPRMTPPDRSSS